MIQKIPIPQTASAMGVEETQLWTLLDQGGIIPQDNALTQVQLQQLVQLLEHRQEESRRRAQESLERVVEPQPTPEMVRDVPGMADELRRPMMLIVRAERL